MALSASITVHNVNSITLNGKSVPEWLARFWVGLDIGMSCSIESEYLGNYEYNHKINIDYTRLNGDGPIGRWESLDIADNRGNNFSLSANGTHQVSFVIHQSSGQSDSEIQQQIDSYRFSITSSSKYASVYVEAGEGGTVNTTSGVLQASIYYYTDPKGSVYGPFNGHGCCYDRLHVKASPSKGYRFDHWEVKTNSPKKAPNSSSTDWNIVYSWKLGQGDDLLFQDTLFPVERAIVDTTYTSYTNIDKDYGYTGFSEIDVIRNNINSFDIAFTGSLWVKAVFKPIPVYKVDFYTEPVQGGAELGKNPPYNYSRWNCTVNGTGEYEEGETCKITYTPDVDTEFCAGVVQVYDNDGNVTDTKLWSWLEQPKDNTIEFTVTGNTKIRIACFYNKFTAIPIPRILNPDGTYIENAGGTFTLSKTEFNSSDSSTSIGVQYADITLTPDVDFSISDPACTPNSSIISYYSDINSIGVESDIYTGGSSSNPDWIYHWYSWIINAIRESNCYYSRSGVVYGNFVATRKFGRISIEFPYYKRFPYFPPTWPNFDSGPNTINNFVLTVNGNTYRVDDVLTFDLGTLVKLEFTSRYNYLGIVSVKIKVGNQEWVRAWSSNTPITKQSFTIQIPTTIPEGQIVYNIMLKMIVWHTSNGRVFCYGTNHIPENFGKIVMDKDKNIMMMKFQLPT